MRYPRTVRVLFVACSVLAVACGGDDGHLLLVDLRTDLAPGREFDFVRVSLLADGEERTQHEQAVSPSDSFARGMRVAELGGLSPGGYELRAEAILAGTVVVARTVAVEVRGDLGLVVILTRSCADVSCPRAGDPAGATSCVGGLCERPTCLEGTEDSCGPAQCRRDADCASASACVESMCAGAWCVEIPRDERCIGGICEYEAGCVAARVDAGMVDAGTEADSGVVTCEVGFADCNRSAADGCEADLGSSSTCGSCDTVCPEATPLCASGSCVSGCGAGETLCSGACVDVTSSLLHCGDCGATCPDLPNSVPRCSAGACVRTCDRYYDDCDGSDANGCETRLVTLEHCGACGRVCNLGAATESCDSGTCMITSCNAGWDNCDGAHENGCETMLNTLANCGTCGAACNLANATESCATGACRLSTCNPGFGNCDGNDANGCETPLNTLTNCGNCGTACTRANASATCAGGTCRIGTCNMGWLDCDGIDANGCEAMPMTCP